MRLALVLVAFLIVVAPAGATTIPVTTLADDGATGDCSLRDAVEAANTNAAVDACAAGTGSDRDVITLPAGTVTLAGGPLELTDGVTVRGAQTTVTGAAPVFDVKAETTLERVVISDSAGAGVESTAGLRIVESTLSGNQGSAVVARGQETTVERSTFTGNSAAGGGGAMRIVTGAVLIENSTFSGNSAAERGGALAVLSSGAPTAFVTVRYSTFTGNTATDVADGGGGAIWSAADDVVNLDSSILAGNTALGGGDGPDLFGEFVDQGGNVVGVVDGSDVTAAAATRGTLGAPVDPQLDSDLVPAATSPAVGLGRFATCPVPVGTDQRGTVRPQGTACDSGAVERAVPDSAAPATTLGGRPATPSGSSVAFTFSGTDEGGFVAGFRCALDGATPVPCSSPFTAELPDGPHTFRVAAVDAAGNVDPTPEEHTWVVDADPPETVILEKPADPATSPTATFTFRGDDAGVGGVTFTCRLDLGPTRPCEPGVTYFVANGGHQFTVTATDAAGHTDPTPAVHQWLVAVPPPPHPTPTTAPEPTPTASASPTPTPEPTAAPEPAACRKRTTRLVVLRRFVDRHAEIATRKGAVLRRVVVRRKGRVAIARRYKGQRRAARIARLPLGRLSVRVVVKWGIDKRAVTRTLRACP